MNCPRCGKEIPKDQRKCPRCGSEIIFKTTDELLEEADILDLLEAHLEKSSSLRTFAAGETIGNKYIIKGAREERGNFGIVYRVEDKNTNKVWALKSIYEKLLTSPEAAASLKDELAIVLSLDHPNLIKLEDYGSHEDSIFTVSEYWVGVPLNKLVEGRKDLNRPFKLDEIAGYFEPVLDAMEYVHNMQLLHGNLIPSNVIVRREVDLLKEVEGGQTLEEVKVSDLGLFQGLYNYIPQLELVNFSLREFRAPEIYARKAEFLTTRADIFSLGALLYLLIFMIPPSAEMSVEKINLDGRPYPEKIVTILKKCLNPYPEERFESINALKSNWFTLTKEAAKPKKPLKPVEEVKAVKEEVKPAEIKWEAEKTVITEGKIEAPERALEEPIVIEAEEPKEEAVPKEYVKALEERARRKIEIEKEVALKPRSIAPVLAILITVLIAAAAAIYFYITVKQAHKGLEVTQPQEQTLPPEQKQVSPEVVTPQPVAPAEQPPAQEQPQQPAIEEQPTQATQPVAPITNPRVRELLDKAKSALDAKKLTRPVRESALYYYREALKIEKDNAEALEGLNELAKAAVVTGDDRLIIGDLEAAERFYRAALSAVPDYPPALAGLNKVRMQRAQPAPAQKPQPPKPAPPPEESVNLEELMPPSPKPQEKKEPERAVEKTAPTAPTSTGTIDVKKVNETIQNQYMGRIRLCYATGLEQNPNLAGDVVIKFTIGLEGKVIAADVASSTLPDANAVECIRRRFLIMEFTTPSGGPVTINYRLSFKP